MYGLDKSDLWILVMDKNLQNYIFLTHLPRKPYEDMRDVLYINLLFTVFSDSAYNRSLDVPTFLLVYLDFID